jgi:hypothetical protein
MLVKQKTNKLFYGKYPYKVTCRVDGAHYIRKHSVSVIRYIHHFTPLDAKGKISDDLIEFIFHAQHYLANTRIKKRIEYYFVDFYVETESEYLELQTRLAKYAVCVTEPDNAEQLKTLLENKKYNLCNKLPHNKYRYKVTFKDMPVKVRNDLITWAERYNNDDIYITESTRRHFKSVKYHHGSHYFYVKDSKMITLIAMAAGGYIRKTDEYVVRNSINTESNQESLCQL